MIYHWACERIADQLAIQFDPPQFIDKDTLSKTVTILVIGRCGESTQWSFGEVTAKNCQNAYPWAMAEKRAKDRVILKFAGLSGDVYSEEEADTFKGNGATPPTAPPSRKSSAQAKRDGDDTLIKGRLVAALNVEEIDAIWADIQENTIPALPIAWEQGMQDFYETQRIALKDQAA